jgi:hypothetical protein
MNTKNWPDDARIWRNADRQLDVEVPEEMEQAAMMAAFAEQLRRQGWRNVRLWPVAVDLILACELGGRDGRAGRGRDRAD